MYAKSVDTKLCQHPYHGHRITIHFGLVRTRNDSVNSVVGNDNSNAKFRNGVKWTTNKCTRLQIEKKNKKIR